MQNGAKGIASFGAGKKQSSALRSRSALTQSQMSTHSNIPGTSQNGATNEGSALPSSGLLKESLAAQLREAILSGKLAPGEKIIERRWAREFGAAQVSVREALNILIAEGFVTKGHGRSARVLRLTDAAIIHTYQVRGALEGLAARIIVEQNCRLPTWKPPWWIFALPWKPTTCAA